MRKYDIGLVVGFVLILWGALSFLWFISEDVRESTNYTTATIIFGVVAIIVGIVLMGVFASKEDGRR